MTRVRVVVEGEPVEEPADEASQLASLKKQLAQQRKNFYRLQEQKAKYGMAVPLNILNEIDDTEEEIACLEAEIAELEGGK